MCKKNGEWQLNHINYEIAPISLSNSTSRKVIKNIEDLFVTVFKMHDEDTRKDLFKDCIDLYKEIITIIRQRNDFADNEINILQEKIDKWHSLWIDLTGIIGQTNYIHILSSGHLSYYLKRYKNLYRYSNQAWERLNNRFFFKVHKQAVTENMIIDQVIVIHS